MSPVERASRSSDTSAPLVSVVVAAYNAASYIEQTCRSVLHQTYAPLELIVVDDGSTDDTAAIVGRLAAIDSRIHLIRQPNRGVAAARNRAIEVATGEFLAPLDADDLWAPEKLAQQVARFLEAGPDTGMVYCWWAWIDSHNYVMDRSPRWRVEGRALERLIEVNFTGSASVPLYRRSAVVEIGGFNESLRDKQAQGCEDWDLAIRIAERYPIAVVRSVLVGYRRRPGSMSSACDVMWRSQEEVMGALAKRQPTMPASTLERSNGQFALHLAGVAFWSGAYLEAFRWGLRARPLSLSVSVFPHVARLLLRRMLGFMPARPTWAPDNGAFNETLLPEPLIPYDAIYERHWHERDRG
jgi:hypothetical protein